MSVVLSNIGQLDFYQKMFIKVERDIVDVILHQQRGKERERAIDIMVQLMTASRTNSHKVYLKCQLTDEDRKTLEAALDENSMTEFKKLQKERIDVDGLIAKLDIYAVISKSKHCSRVGKELQINPFEEDTFLLGVPTFLCTENQRDGKFYQIVCNYYLSQERILNMASRYKTWKGGGSDFGNALKNDSILSDNFIFAIADSDKCYPNDKIGKTAKSIKFLGHNRYNADYYILLNVSEIENLIPIKLVKKYNSDIAACLRDSDLSYFDFKEGLKYQILYEKDSRDYWKSNFSRITIDWDEIIDFAKDKSYSDYCDKVHGKTSLVPGCGKNLLDSLLNDNEWKNIREADFTQSQLSEWKEIGKKVFSWTCCSKKKV